KENLQISHSSLWEKFTQAFAENTMGYLNYYRFFADRAQPSVKIIQGSSLDKHKYIGQESVDLIVTSPPYGDSKTTVAYGQFSRLSSQWLELGGEHYTSETVARLDSDLLGGKT